MNREVIIGIRIRCQLDFYMIFSNISIFMPENICLRGNMRITQLIAWHRCEEATIGQISHDTRRMMEVTPIFNVEY
jgi:hypothetical protein